MEATQDYPELCPEPHTLVEMEATDVGQRTAESLARHFGGNYLANDCDCTDPPYHPKTR